MKKLVLSMLLLGSFNSFAMQIEEFYDDQSGDLSALINSPSLGNYIPISAKSNQSGVCKALGYERAADGSVISGDTYRGAMVVMSIDGLIRSGEVATNSSGYEIKQIICLNKLSSPKERTFILNNPLHQNANVPFSTRSDQNGVCKALGYKSAAVGSAIAGTSYRGAMVVVTEDGSVMAGEVATGSSGYEIKSIVCINNI